MKQPPVSNTVTLLSQMLERRNYPLGSWHAARQSSRSRRTAAAVEADQTANTTPFHLFLDLCRTKRKDKNKRKTHLRSDPQ